MSVTREYQAAGKKRVNVVEARWLGDEAFVAGHPGRPTIRLDGTGKTGPGPVEAVLCALAACASIDVVQILAKRRTPVEALEVRVEGDRADSVPARLTSIRLHFRIKGTGIEPEQAIRAVGLAVNRYCSVRESLDPSIAIDSVLELNDSDPLPVELPEG
jgi:putative redox protein